MKRKFQLFEYFFGRFGMKKVGEILRMTKKSGLGRDRQTNRQTDQRFFGSGLTKESTSYRSMIVVVYLGGWGGMICICRSGRFICIFCM